MNQYNQLTDTRYGKMLYVSKDFCIGAHLEKYGEFSQGEMDLLFPYIPKGGVCVDIGANIGTHTLFFANAVGVNGTVVAFEPQRCVFQLLCANIALNQHLNVYSYCLALGDYSGEAHLPCLDYHKVENFGMVQISKQNGIVIEIKKLDDFAFRSIDLIKMDVEGFEPEVMLGAQETIRKHRPLIYAEYHPEKNSQNLIEILQKLDYEIFVHSSFNFNPNNYKKCSEVFFPDYWEVNLFCFPKGRADIPSLPRFQDAVFKKISSSPFL